MDESFSGIRSFTTIDAPQSIADLFAFDIEFGS